MYQTLDVQVTLRCNARCRNCIKLCGMDDVTGLDYSQTDMTLDQIATLRDELADRFVHHGTMVIGVLCLTGGEAMLHPHIHTIVEMLDPLVSIGAVGHITINTNGLVEVPELSQYAVTYTPIPQKAATHNVVLLHPNEIEPGPHGFEQCQHYRKWRPVVNCYGHSLCCAADGYIRLFGLDHLIVPRLPESFDGYPLDKMDDVCSHCPFGASREIFERDAGRPVSVIYGVQAAINRAGRSLKSRYR